MRNNLFTKILILSVYAIIFTSYLIAGTTGKISGKVLDKSSGEPLPGVNIIIKGTSYGTSTNLDGEYTILNIQPGKYDITFGFIGYTPLTITDVNVDIDRTTKLDAELQFSSIELSEVVIKAQKSPVVKDRTYSSVVINSESISNLPVTELSEVITLQPGVVKSGGALHFRGGREREVAYIIDGIPVTNSFSQSGGSNVDVENSMVSQLEVITGTFNAEYGAAQSGVVNIVTKDIAKTISGSASFYTGDYLSSESDVFLGIDKFNPVAEKDFQFSLNAPLITDVLGISFNGRYNSSQSLYSYERRFTSLDGWKIAAYDHWFRDYMSDETGSTQAINIPDSLKTGDLAVGPLAKYQELDFNVKLNYVPIPEIKLSYQIFGERESTNGRVDLSRMYAPDNLEESIDISLSHFITFKHIPSEKFFYNIGFSYQYNDGESFYRKDNKIAQFPGDDGIQPISISSDGFSLGTTDGFYTDADGKNYREQILVNGDFNWQVDNYNFIKGGFEFKKHKINTYSWGYVETKDWENKKWLGSDDLPGLDFAEYWSAMTEYWKNWEETFDTTKYRKVSESEYALWRDYTIEPYEIAGYIQDKVELGEIIINGGIRLDMFFPNEKVPINYKVEATKLGSTANQQEAKNVVSLSPRFGVSFPISESGVFHAAYGHFSQMPSFEKMYNEPLRVLTPIQLDGRTLGNANLEPEKTIQYELGLQQQIIPGLTIDVSAYYKDIRNLLGVEYITTVDNVRYLRYINRDYGNGKGITIGLRQYSSAFFNGTINYTYSTANGSSSNPEEVEIFQASTQIGGDPVEFVDRQIIPLVWDQTHTFNVVANFNFENNLNINVVGSVWTGQPYSPTFVEKYDILEVEYKNSDSKPLQWNVDLKASKQFVLGGLNYVVYLKIDNVFDHLNQVSVYSSTGRANQNSRLPEDLELELERISQAGLFTLPEIDNRPDWFSSPRKVQLGLEVHF
ncbi:MAG: TonB-dependent receptor [Ignavibacteriaceae bacterium]